MPLPMQLSHINLWLLDDGDGPAIVDTGINSRETREHWTSLLGEPGADTAPTRLIVTHLHPDHVGAAGWLCERYGLELSMSRAEYLLCRVLIADTGPAPAEGIRFYREAGLDDEQIERYKSLFGGFGRACSPLPNAYRRLTDGETIDVGKRCWRIVVGRGHSPEHACLYDATNNVLIAGDQVLPTISSNVGVWPTEPFGNPLADWLDSCRYLIETLPSDVLVLPSHGKPFRGAHERLSALISEHEQGLAALLALCREPKRAVDVFPALFKSRITETNLLMATGEAIAHLNYLKDEGAIDTDVDRDGVRWYRAA